MRPAAALTTDSDPSNRLKGADNLLYSRRRSSVAFGGFGKGCFLITTVGEMMKRVLWAVAFLTLLTGCSEQHIRDTNSPYFSLPVGSVVELNQPLELPAERTRIFFQRGMVSGKQGIDLYYPSCNLEVRDLKPDVQRIESDRFTIVHTRQGKESVVEWDGVKLAGLGWSFPFGGGPPMVHRYYHYRLESERQPQVMRLTCRGALADLWEANAPTLGESREALGEIATFLLEP